MSQIFQVWSGILWSWTSCFMGSLTISLVPSQLDPIPSQLDPFFWPTLQETELTRSIFTVGRLSRFVPGANGREPHGWRRWSLQNPGAAGGMSIGSGTSCPSTNPHSKKMNKKLSWKNKEVYHYVYIYIFFLMNHVFVLRRDGGERERARAILHLTLSTLNSEILLYCSTLYHSTNTGESTPHGTAWQYSAYKIFA